MSLCDINLSCIHPTTLKRKSRKSDLLVHVKNKPMVLNLHSILKYLVIVSI